VQKATGFLAHQKNLRTTVIPTPNRPGSTILILIAGLMVAGAVIPWALRVPSAIGAGCVLVAMIVSQSRARTAKVQKRRVSDTYAAVERLRAERKERFERNRPRRRH
jgi:uncharacterized membrane protein